ncbi:unnamed protein product [Rotaria magnacalcarata]|uniref:Uncharacterized protein n=4 Tax=Rotaria magnacalcarata TaxID=392030 RepID=A0A820BNV8_9BILA|nr:unnamed protein product [Rotaria magnacalcarata]CAF1294399.1 unnamed protein product [Rotaria magnacalcarata]CAF1936629.1 unnamed protein product [Rotaria magnacalcarata]CAF1945718.1 unnamed protein product [Rotaria magnacalcarata]CAF2159733.1 unnamed protein product [Rotaria magnacalcarata]
MGNSRSTVTQSNHNPPSQVQIIQEEVSEKQVHFDSQEKSVKVNSQEKSVQLDPQETLVKDDTQEKSVKGDPQEKTVDVTPQENPDAFDLTKLTQPISISHAKPGNTICGNDHVLLLQDGSTTIEFRIPPKFQSKCIPWNYGLIRDIIWCSNLNIFILLTRDSLLSISPEGAIVPAKTTTKSLDDFKIHKYPTVKPYDSSVVFWRCTCIGTSLFITYSGFGTVIDEYSMRANSCKIVNRYMPPNTCAVYEGIWCIRSLESRNQLGLTIMDARNNQWRVELRNGDDCTIVWKMVLPIQFGDCELTILPNEEWLIVNSCGIRLIQIANQKIKAGVEYERELRNAVAIGKSYFAIRTKSTVEIHRVKQLK